MRLHINKLGGVLTSCIIGSFNWLYFDDISESEMIVNTKDQKLLVLVERQELFTFILCVYCLSVK